MNSEINCTSEIRCTIGQEASVETTFKTLQVLKNRGEITKEDCNALKNSSKTFLIALAAFPCKYTNDDIMNYRLYRCMISNELDLMDYIWGMRVTDVRLYYNLGDNRFLEEAEKICTLWKANCLPNLNTLIMEFAYTPCTWKVDTLFPEDTELFSVFKKVVFSHGCGQCHIDDCHKLAMQLFPHLKQIESVVLAVHKGNYPYWIQNADHWMKNYGQQSAQFVESCEKNKVSVEIQLNSKLCKPWSDDCLM